MGTHILREEDDGERASIATMAMATGGVVNAPTNQIHEQGRSLWPLDQSETRWNFDLKCSGSGFRASLLVMIKSVAMTSTIVEIIR